MPPVGSLCHADPLPGLFVYRPGDRTERLPSASPLVKPVSFSATGFMKVTRFAASVQITASPIDCRVTLSRSFSSASIAAETMQARFGLLAPSDVGQAADGPDQPPDGVTLDGLAAVEDPDPVPVLVAHSELGFEKRRLAGEVGAVGLGDELAVVGMDVVSQRSGSPSSSPSA